MTLPRVRSELESLGVGADAADRRVIDLLLGVIDSWVSSPDRVDVLIRDLDRALGHSWVGRDNLHSQVAALIDALRQEVEGLGGMTMNERLFAFGLLDSWDAASDPARQVLGRKVEAT